MIRLDPARARVEYGGAPIPALFAADALDAAQGARLRDLVLAAPRARFADRADRGRYEVASARDGGLEAAALDFVTQVTGRDLELSRARMLVFGRGDYALSRDDEDAETGGVEVTFDLSERATHEADLVYARPSGEIVFAAPQLPGSLSIVARATGVRRYERYLTHRVGELRVVRARLLFRQIGVAATGL